MEPITRVLTPFKWGKVQHPDEDVFRVEVILYTDGSVWEAHITEYYGPKPVPWCGIADNRNEAVIKACAASKSKRYTLERVFAALGILYVPRHGTQDR